MRTSTLLWVGGGVVAAYYLGLLKSCGFHICVGDQNTPMADGRQMFTPAGYAAYLLMTLTTGGFA